MYVYENKQFVGELVTQSFGLKPKPVGNSPCFSRKYQGWMIQQNFIIQNSQLPENSVKIPSTSLISTLSDIRILTRFILSRLPGFFFYLQSPK